MTSATTILFKPLQSLRSQSYLPTNSITPAAALLSKKVSQNPFLYLLFKPVNLILSPQPKHKISHPILVSLAAQTSDWGQQEEEEEGSVDDEDSSFPDPPEEAKIFVGNLPYDFDSEKLADLFNQAGVVEIAEVIYNRDTDQSRGFGFVTMSTVEEADNAVEKFHRYELNGRLLTVNKAAPRGSQPERAPKVFASSFRVYVGNLPWQMDSVRLREVFSEHGKVVDAKVIFDRETGRSRGFGFVSMATETDMNDAIAALDGQSLDGRAIRVNVAEERARLSSF